jgi:hypothetical protein
MVALRAAFTVLRARYSRRVNTAISLLLLYVLALVLLLVNVERGYGFRPETMIGILKATRWIAAAAFGLATVYLFSSSLAERVLTPVHACVAVLISALFVAALLTTLRTAGVQLAGLSTSDTFWMLSPAMLPLMVSALAPWSLHRIRHI